MGVKLDDFKIVCQYPVHWGDMDAANHVNNLVYMKWGESSRLTYFEHMGMDVSFKGSDAGPILGWQECKYIFPMEYPDTALVGVRAYELLEDRFILESAIFSEKHDRIAALLKQSIIPYSYTTLRKVPLPEKWRQKIQAIEK